MLDRAVANDFDVDYDLGFVSETDLSAVHERRNVRLASAESALSGITSRIGSRFPGLGRWAGSRKNSITALSLSEGSCDAVGAAAHASSSRSSSISSRLRPNYPHPSEATISASPRNSLWDSTESVALPNDPSTGAARREMDRDRRLATTPLLPPLITDSETSGPGQFSPSFPFPTPVSEPHSQTAPQPIPAPSLRTKASVTSFQFSPTRPELPIPFPNLLNDEWSDRLGHANFTIIPTPYQPEEATIPALKKLRQDWDLARVNYTKHLFRTGENYGETSNIYALTQEKWAEVERTWRRIHDETMERVISSAASSPEPPKPRSRSRGRGRDRAGSSAAALGHTAEEVLAGPEWRRVDHGGPALPRMMSDKFPSRGDEDIVGPMVREEVARTESADGRGARLWKNLMKVGGLRR